MDTTLEQLARYVYQQMQQGVSEQDIRAALAQNRWTPDWIDAVFNVVHQNPNMFKAPAIQPLKPTNSLQPVSAASKQAPQRAKPTFPLKSDKAVTPKKNQSKKLLLVIAVVIVLLGLAAGAYFFLQQKDKSGNTTSNGQSANTPAAEEPKEEEKKPAKTPDEQRKEHLNILLSNLADYYVVHKMYPTYDALKSKSFADQNPDFDISAFADPKWAAANTSCTRDGNAIMAAKPTAGCYAYNAVSSENAACDNQNVTCTRITVTSVLDDDTEYRITLDRNTQAQN